MSFLNGVMGQWRLNQQLNSFKKEINDTFGGANEQPPPGMYLDDEPDVAYNKEEHQGYYAKKAQAANTRGKGSVKSDAVRAAMERRAAAQAAAAAKGRK